MFDLFRRLTWLFDRFRNNNSVWANRLYILFAALLCIFMLITQVSKLLKWL